MRYRGRLQSMCSKLDEIINSAIARGDTAGAVIAVGERGGVIYQRAYGWRRVVPRKLPMRVDTVFDLASLTKVVATAPAIALLKEYELLDWDDRVHRYIPEFSGGTKRYATIRHLLTHTSGLPPFKNYLAMKFDTARIINDICHTRLRAAPGKRFIYSDLGFILLGEIVHRLSEMPLDEFVRVRFFNPMGMRRTRFRPPKSWHRQCAATTFDERTGEMLCGIVHDPNARIMGGVAGHAGLFSTAADLARYCQMLLNCGVVNGRHLFRKQTVRAMTANQCPVKGVKRGFGFDIKSPYSHPRGHRLSSASYGHTGFTGTSLWVDPVNGIFIILLTNRLHPDGNGDVRKLRAQVADVVYECLVK